MSQDPTQPDANRPARDPEDPFVARLRAADPARDHRVDLDALRAAVAARAAAPDPQRGTDELAAARARRWTTWPARTAVAAAAALLIGGGGGYAIGAGSTDPSAPAEPAIVVGGPQAPGPQPGEDAAIGQPGALGAPELAGSGAMVDRPNAIGGDMYPSYGGRTVFTASGLSSDAGTAPAWAYDGASGYDADRLAAAAAALGVDGEVQDLGWMLSVGVQDGTGPSVQLNRDGQATLSFYDPSADPWMCGRDGGQVEEPPSDGGGTSGSAGEDSEGSEGSEGGAGAEVMPEPAPPVCDGEDLGAPPSRDQAVGELRDLLGRLGMDADAYEYEAMEDDGTGWRTVNAFQVVDGQRTGAHVSGTWTGGGLHSLYAPTAPLVALGDYPVVSAQDAVERLMDPRFGASWAGPVPFLGAESGGVADADTSVSSEPAPDMVEPAPLPRTPQPGDALTWPVAQVTITQARLGLALHHQPSGAVLLLPTYELTSDDGSAWTVLAVADERLDFDGGR